MPDSGCLIFMATMVDNKQQYWDIWMNDAPTVELHCRYPVIPYIGSLFNCY